MKAAFSRKDQTEGTALPGKALYTDSSSVDLHDLSDHGQTQTCAENIPGAAGAVRPVKAFKNAGLVFCGNSDPVIGDRQDHPLVFVLVIFPVTSPVPFLVTVLVTYLVTSLALKPDKDMSLFFSVFIGIVDQILQGAFQQELVSADPHAGLYLSSHGNVPGADERHVAGGGIRKL